MSAPRREIAAWSLYDFANSAFATSILAVVYQTYFVKAVVPAGGRWSGETLWNFAGAASMIVVCVCAPFLGAVTDYTAAKKRVLAVYWIAGCLATAGLAFVRPGMVFAGMALFLVANLGFAGGNAIYNAFLPELAEPAAMARVSSIGWGLGYAGGGLCLLLNLAMLKLGLPIGLGFAVVAAWWFAFALPLFLHVRERAVPKPRPPGRSLLGAGIADVLTTLRNIRRHKELFKFLIAYLLFNEGVETVIFNAAGYGARVVGMSAGELIAVFLAVQGVALGGAFLFARIAERWSGKRAIALSLVVWIAVLVFGFFATTRAAYWTLGILVGLVMGGTQALSRAFFGQLTPAAKTGEFFGFFAIGGKFAAALGPLLFGTVTHLTGTMRWGIVSIAVFFLAGLLLLSRVDEKRGLAEAGG